MEAKSLESGDFDGVVVVHWPGSKVKHEVVAKTMDIHLEIDPGLVGETIVLPVAGLPCGKLVLASTGGLDVDYDDVRSIKEAASRGIKRALSAGIRRPVVLLRDHERFVNAKLVTLLGVLEALHVVRLQMLKFLQATVSLI